MWRSQCTPAMTASDMVAINPTFHVCACSSTAEIAQRSFLSDAIIELQRKEKYTTQILWPFIFDGTPKSMSPPCPVTLTTKEMITLFRIVHVCERSSTIQIAQYKFLRNTINTMQSWATFREHYLFTVDHRSQLTIEDKSLSDNFDRIWQGRQFLLLFLSVLVHQLLE